MNKNQKGFSVVAILLGLIVVSTIGFVGWITVNKNTEKVEQSPELANKGAKIHYIHQGASMEPTIGNEQEIRGYKVQPSEVKRGDIIAFTSPITGADPAIKRVVGLPGDAVTVANGSISVVTSEGNSYNPGLAGAPISQNLTKVVLPDTFFVVGDNLANSFDSRIDGFGLVPFKNLIAIIEL